MAKRQTLHEEMEQSILTEAAKVIYGDREKTYGHPAKNLKHIAALWNVHLKHKYGAQFRLTVDDVCQLLIHLKQARLANQPTHRDGWVDIAGYSALADRCQRHVG